MLKNPETKKYQQLMKIEGKFRLLLTGTPLQNNLPGVGSTSCIHTPWFVQGASC